MNKYNITIFEDKHKTQVIDLWEKCNLIKSWNDPNKDIDRKLKVNDSLFLIVEFNKVIIGSAMISYDGHRGVSTIWQWILSIKEKVWEKYL